MAHQCHASPASLLSVHIGPATGDVTSGNQDAAVCTSGCSSHGNRAGSVVAGPSRKLY